jgi:hypothetical protein
MRVFALAFWIALAFVEAAKADFTGIHLYKICNGMLHVHGEGEACTAYIRGFSEGYYLGLLAGTQIDTAHRRVCFPQPPDEEPPDVLQTESVVKKYKQDQRRSG